MNAVGDAKVEKAKGASSETDFAKKRRFAAELFERGFGYKKTSAILELSENTVKDWAKAYKRGLSAAQFARYVGALQSGCPGKSRKTSGPRSVLAENQ